MRSRSPPGTPQNRSAFIWYSTSIFDFQRNATRDAVFIDISSRKLIISGFVGHSKYATAVDQSATSSNATWSDMKTFSYVVTASNVERGIADGMRKFPHHFVNKTLPPKAWQYCVPGFNLELEATPGAGAGIAVRGLNITQI